MELETEEFDFDNNEFFEDFDELDELDELDIDEREERFDRDEFILSLQRDIANGYEARQILERLTH
jgi:hypothetical protein